MTPNSHKSDEHSLILVDEQDQVLGYLDKDQVHDGDGILHRAFSVLVFDESGRLLVQKRSENKRLWPHYWANTCCSHPWRDEEIEAAAERRLDQELGLSCPLQFLYRFQYQAHFENEGAEHELCSVFSGRTESDVTLAINPHEVADCRWITATELNGWMADESKKITPWFRLEWERVLRDFPQLTRPETR